MTARGPTELEAKPLGLVWLKYDADSVPPLELRSALAAHTRVHLGHNPPTQAAPTFVLLCTNREQGLPTELRRLCALAPEATVLVCGPRPDPRLFRRVMEAGASGFIHGGLGPERLVRVLSLASAGEIVVSREALRDLLEGEGPGADLSALTRRQVEILELVAKGHTNAEIAKQLFLAEGTVKQHLYKAYKALGVENRHQAARLLARGNPARPFGGGAA